jgi:hypothetical protein
MFISHYKVVPSHEGPRRFALAEALKSDGTASVLHDMTHLAELKGVERINWPRSFARFNKRYADYELVQTSLNNFSFSRKAEADVSLPERLVFQKLQDVGAVQGDVLCYVQQEQHIHVKEIGFFEGFIAGPDTAALIGEVFEGDSWAIRLGQVTRMHQLITEGLKASFLNTFCNRWDPKCSLMYFNV